MLLSIRDQFKVGIGLEVYIRTLVVHQPVLVCFCYPISKRLATITDVGSIDFVDNNPASFKNAYFDFASIRTFAPAENPFTPLTLKGLKRHLQHRRSFNNDL